MMTITTTLTLIVTSGEEQPTETHLHSPTQATKVEAIFACSCFNAERNTFLHYWEVIIIFLPLRQRCDPTANSLLYGNTSRPARGVASKGPRLKNRAKILHPLCSNPIFHNRSRHRDPPWLWHFPHLHHFGIWLWHTTLTLTTPFSPYSRYLHLSQHPSLVPR